MSRENRMKKELQLLRDSPPCGISCWPKEDKIDELEAQIIGSDGTPYEGGVFKIEIQIPSRYPFEPPKVRFVTPIYHPNIDSAGRICLDSLRMPPKGAWKPSLNISTLLTTIRLLMSEPNADDPLMAEIAGEFKSNRYRFEQKAKHQTRRFAMQNSNNNTDEKKIEYENLML